MIILLILLILLVVHLLNMYGKHYIGDTEFKLFDKYQILEWKYLVYSLLFVSICGYLYSVNKMDLFTSFKYMLLGVVLIKLAQIDLKTYSVPLLILIYLGITRIVLIAIEVLVYQNLIIEILSVYGIGILVALSISLVVYFASKKGIGEGDIILLSIVGGFVGFSNILTIYVLTVIIALFISIYYLVRKLKTKKESIPMIPCIMISVILNMLLVYM